MTESHNGSFSYESPERQRRSALKVLIAEIMVLGFVAIGIFGLLFYLRIIQPPDFIAQFFPQEKSANLVAVSEIPGYKVTIVKKDELMSYVEENRLFERIYNRTGNIFLRGDMKGEPLKSINIHVVSNPQVGNAYSDGSSTFSSVGLILNPGEVNIYIQIGRTLLNKNNLNDANVFLQEQLVSSIYILANDVKTIPDLNREKDKVYEMVRQQIKNRMNFLMIERE